MERARHLGILAVGALLALAPLAGAQEDSIQVVDGLQYLSTGVGKDTRGRVRSELPLKLIFANERGEFFANVEVQITDLSTRKTVSIKSEGPWLFVGLRPGNYSVRAAADGARASARVEVGEKQRVLIMRLRP